MSLADSLTRSELAWLATLNPEPLTAGEAIAHQWAKMQMHEVARRAKAATGHASPKRSVGGFLTRDWVLESRRDAAGAARAGNQKYLTRAMGTPHGR